MFVTFIEQYLEFTDTEQLITCHEVYVKSAWQVLYWGVIFLEPRARINNLSIETCHAYSLQVK
ncbi:MAG: hypothetical protein SAL70_05980 [Scytonema sp. PMC 1070.18]|nr:hypothetical protein [Scytonema sp. PMC 1070.18]